MTRFATDLTKLEQDGAMLEYRKSKTAPLFDPAEWIEALHQEHWETLEELRLLKQATEGSRLARVLDDLKLARLRMNALLTVLGVQSTQLADVLGRTPTVGALKDVARELRGVSAALDELVARESG